MDILSAIDDAIAEAEAEELHGKLVGLVQTEDMVMYEIHADVLESGWSVTDVRVWRVA